MLSKEALTKPRKQSAINKFTREMTTASAGARGRAETSPSSVEATQERVAETHVSSTESQVEKPRSAQKAKWYEVPKVEQYYVSPSATDVPRVRARITEICQNAKKMLLEGSKAPDPHRPENAWVEEKIWKAVYEPYSNELTKLKEHLRGEQYLKYPCTIKLRDPKTKPFVAKPFNLRDPEKQKASDETMERFLDLGIIEHGTAEWLLAAFVVPQTVSEEQKILAEKEDSGYKAIV